MTLDPLTHAARRACASCGTDTVGPFCHQCGQRQVWRPRSLAAIMRGAFADITNVDARLHRTVRVLVTKPGDLTREYIAGRQIPFIPPVRLYLAASLIYFAIFAATGSSRFFVFWTGGGAAGLPSLASLLPKLMFLMLPVFAGFTGLLHPRRCAYEAHFVFALHYHAFAFLVLPIVSLLQPVLRASGPDGRLGVAGTIAAVVSLAVEIWVIAHLYFALRRVYGERPLRVAAKSILLFFGYMAVLATVGVILLPVVRAL